MQSYGQSDSLKFWEIPSVHIETKCFEYDQVKLNLVHFIPQKNKKDISIVFIAGWITQIETWKEVLEGFSPEYPVYYLETREKISSQMPKNAGFGVQDIAGDIAEFVKKLDLKAGSYVLMGSSLGATAIVEACRFLKNKPHSVILINPNTEFRVPRFGIVLIHLVYPPLYFLILPFVKWYLRKFRLNVKADPQQYEKYARALDAADPWKLKKAVLALSSYSIWDSLKYVSCPVLIIGASEDKLHEPQKLQRMQNEFKEAKTVDLKTNEAAHGRALIEAVENFLGKMNNS